MNDFRLIARFNSKPSEHRRKEIEKEVELFISNSIPSSNFVIECGEGSWWIAAVGVATPVAIWLGTEISNWVISEGLDLLVEKIKNKRAQKEQSQLSELDKRSQEIVPQTSNSSIIDQDAFVKLAELTKAMNGIATQIGANHVQFGEWSHELDRGRIISLKRDSQEISVSVIQTDSQDDFNSRTSYP